MADCVLSTNVLNSQVYANLAKALSERGLERTAEQCKVKLKNLRAEHTRRRHQLAASGGGALEPMSHQELLHEIFGTRPSANAAAVSFDATFPQSGHRNPIKCTKKYLSNGH